MNAERRSVVGDEDSSSSNFGRILASKSVSLLKKMNLLFTEGGGTVGRILPRSLWEDLRKIRDSACNRFGLRLIDLSEGLGLDLSE